MCVDNSGFAACAPVGPGVVIVAALSSTSPCARLPPLSRAYSLRARLLPALPSPHRHRHHPSCWRCQSVLLACLEMAHPAHHSSLLPRSVRVPFAAALAASPVSGASIERASLPGVHRCAPCWSPLLSLCCTAVLAGACIGPCSVRSHCSSRCSSLARRACHGAIARPPCPSKVICETHL